MRGAAAAQTNRVGRINAWDNPEWADPDLPSQYPVTSGWVDVTGIDDTGATDVTGDLITYFAGLSNGAKVKFGLNKTYRLDLRLYIEDIDNLSIDGNGSTFVTSDDALTYKAENSNNPRAHFEFNRCDDLYVTNTFFEGPNTDNPQTSPETTYNGDLETQHAFSFRGCTRVLLENSGALYTWGDNVYFGSDKSTDTASHHGTVRNSTFGYAGRQIFAIVAGDHYLYEDNTTGPGRRAQVDLEPNGPPGVNYVKVRNNDFGYRRLGFFASGGAPVDVTNILIDNNTVEGSLAVLCEGKAVGTRANWTITNNVAAGDIGKNPPHAMGFKYGDGLVVTGNTQVFEPGRGMFLVGLNQTPNFMVKDNILTNQDSENDGQYRFGQPPAELGEDPTGTITDLPTTIGTSTVKSTNNSLVLPLPSGSATDDAVFILLGRQGLEPTTPAGWTDLMREATEAVATPSLTGWMIVMWKRLTAGDVSTGSVTFTFTDGSFDNRSIAQAITFRDSDDPYGTTISVPGERIASVTCEGPTTTEASKVLYIVGQRNGNADWFPNDSDVELVIQAKNSSATGFSGACGTVNVYGIGECRDRVWTSDQNDQPGAFGVCLPYLAPTP